MDRTLSKASHCALDFNAHEGHSDFWRAHPELRRVPYRFTGWPDRAFDYGHADVRNYHMALVRELVERYDIDGLELDWMRLGITSVPALKPKARRC